MRLRKLLEKSKRNRFLIEKNTFLKKKNFKNFETTFKLELFMGRFVIVESG